MNRNGEMKITSLVHLYERLTSDERIMVDVLRGIVLEHIPGCKEKISFSVPFFYGKKGICIIWPASIPRGGIRKGVLFGFWQGHRLKDEEGFLKHGTNRKIFYRIYQSPDEIDDQPLARLLKEAAKIDGVLRDPACGNEK